jgi:predicted nucleotidyltransferase
MARPAPQSALRFPLSSIFGTETNVRLLRELARHGGQLTPSNLATRTKLALPTVIAALSSLVDTNVVAEVGTGRTRLYNLNEAAPLSAPIQALFEAEEVRFAGIIDAVRDCAESFGEAVVASWVFGSVARGEDQAASDVDIAFVAIRDDDVASIQNRGIDALSASAEKLVFSPSINTFSVTDLKRLRASDDPLWQAFLNEALVITGPRPEFIL